MVVGLGWIFGVGSGWDGDFWGGLLVWVGRVILGLDLVLVFVWIVDDFGFGFGLVG